MTMNESGEINFEDIQGLVVRGYGMLPAASYLLLRVTDQDRARLHLRQLTDSLVFATERPETRAVNLALTYHGLISLGIEQSILEGFSNEFRSGMSTPHKRRILGDEGESAPEHWLWGGPETTPVDIMLLCYGRDDASLAALCDELRAGFRDQGLEEIIELDTLMLPDFREHFGFRDAIGQPYIAEFDSSGWPKPHPVPLGEILLGYPNGYERYTQRPLLEPRQDPDNLLAPDPEGSSLRDLGMNGTYLVFRQLAQDVPGFWQTMQEKAEQLAPGEPRPVWLAAKMVGRWPSGTSLVTAPERDDPSVTDRDDFTYHRTDAEGHKCPLGAHIRRTHPRDSLEPEPGSEKSIAFSNRHRILRRGRVYGVPYHDSIDPDVFLEDLEREDAPVSRGLHFICLNANIGRQFEFVQHTWSNNPNFNGLYRDPDPITGTRQAYGLSQDEFRIQGHPARCKVSGLPAFVQTRGGGYFFLPGRSAMQYLFSTAATGGTQGGAP